MVSLLAAVPRGSTIVRAETLVVAYMAAPPMSTTRVARIAFLIMANLLLEPLWGMRRDYGMADERPHDARVAAGGRSVRS